MRTILEPTQEMLTPMVMAFAMAQLPLLYRLIPVKQALMHSRTMHQHRPIQMAMECLMN
jgi:hypothetical protein